MTFKKSQLSRGLNFNTRVLIELLNQPVNEVGHVIIHGYWLSTTNHSLHAFNNVNATREQYKKVTLI